MIPLLAEVAVVLHQFAAPAQVAGRPARPAPTVSNITASVQPLPDTHRDWLPSGYQVIDSRLIISYSALKAGLNSGAFADRVIHEGVTYEIVSAKPFPAFLIQPPHWEAVGVNVQAIVP